MPYIRKYNDIDNDIDIFESVRLPIKFWKAHENLPVLINISSDNYIGENKFPYYIKSCNFCLTPFLIKRYGNTSETISDYNMIFRPGNSQNIDITSNEINKVSQFSLTITSGYALPEIEDVNKYKQ